MEILEKLATQVTQDEEKQHKDKTRYVLDNTICKQTQINANKTWALLQTTGCKDEPNKDFCI